MAGYSNYAENKVLDHCYGGAAFTQPGNYLALFTAVTDAEAGTGTEVTNANGYARLQVTNFAAAASGSKTTSGNNDFAVATGAGWGTITHAAIFDSGTYGAGNALTAITALSASVAIAAGDIFRFATGNLTVTLD